MADAKAQRDRELVADKIEAMAAAIAQAAPGFNAGAAALVQAVTKSSASIPEATSFATSVDAMRREVLSAADLICWELRTAAVLTRAGKANIAFPAPLINRVVFHRVIALARANEGLFTQIILSGRADGRVFKAELWPISMQSKDAIDGVQFGRLNEFRMCDGDRE